MTAQNKRPVFIVLAALSLLLIPFIAMQFSGEVKWSPVDFVIMGVLLTGTGLLCELVLRSTKRFGYRLLLIAACLFAFLLIWAELAVGIFGSPFAGS